LPHELLLHINLQVKPTAGYLDNVTLTRTQVFCLTDWFYEEALDHARKLDDILERGDQPLGPLHGVPVALKVRQ
jgi:amidase